MTYHPAYGGQPPGPPARPQWSAGRIVTVTLAGLALVVGLLGVLVFVLDPLGGLVPQEPDRDDHGRVLERTTVDKNSLRPGDCLNDEALRDLEPGGDLETIRGTVEVLPCGERHDFEVTAAFVVPHRDYSEADALRSTVHQACLQRLRDDWAEDRTLLRDKLLAYYLPAVSATSEDHAVCMLQLASAERMRGSIR